LIDPIRPVQQQQFVIPSTLNLISLKEKKKRGKKSIVIFSFLEDSASYFTKQILVLIMMEEIKMQLLSRNCCLAYCCFMRVSSP